MIARRTGPMLRSVPLGSQRLSGPADASTPAQGPSTTPLPTIPRSLMFVKAYVPSIPRLQPDDDEVEDIAWLGRDEIEAATQRRDAAPWLAHVATLAADAPRSSGPSRALEQ